MVVGVQSLDVGLVSHLKEMSVYSFERFIEKSFTCAVRAGVSDKHHGVSHLTTNSEGEP